MEGDEKSVRLLVELAKAVRAAIDLGFSQTRLNPEDEVYFHWKIDNFKYDDNGPEVSGARAERIVKRSWFWASAKIEQDVREAEPHRTAYENFKNIFGDRINERSLDKFIETIAADYLERKQ